MIDPHTLWAASQLAPGEGIEDGVARISAILRLAAPAPVVPLTDAAQEIERLRAEVAGLREDAFLYRWLREQHESSDSGETMRVYRPDVGRGCLMPVSIEPGQLNAAIDAARKGTT